MQHHSGRRIKNYIDLEDFLWLHVIGKIEDWVEICLHQISETFVENELGGGGEGGYVCILDLVAAIRLIRLIWLIYRERT